MPVDNIFRMDRGDQEGGDEWNSLSGAKPDRIGDDDVDVRLSSCGEIDVRYFRRTERWFSPRLAMNRAGAVVAESAFIRAGGDKCEL